MKEDIGIFNKARRVVAKWKHKNISHQAAWEELTGNKLAKSTARKYMDALHNFLVNAHPSDRMDKIQLEVETNAFKNKHGETIYTQTSTMLVNIQNVRNKSPEEMVQLHGFDPIQWELVDSNNKIWQGSSKLQGVYSMYSSTVKVKPIQSHLAMDYFERLFENIEVPNDVATKEVVVESKDIMLELPIMDVHIGKLAWHEETGNDYDLSIIRDLYKKTVNDILFRVQSNYDTVGRVLFPIGQDMFHCDNEKGTTTKGTSLSVDSRWQKMFRRGCELNIWAIEKLKTLTNKVDISYIRSNHDEKMSYFLMLYLSAWYKNDPKVNINISSYPRKYYQWDECMIGYLHKMAKKRIDKIMQAEAPEIWGNTRFRELHIGHEHIEGLTEHPGLKVRNVSSITATDDWHCGKGYVNIIRQAQGFVWHKKKGLRNVVNSVVENTVEKNIQEQ